MLLETMKKQYLAMIQTMQSKQYSDNIIKVNWDLAGAGFLLSRTAARNRRTYEETWLLGLYN